MIDQVFEGSGNCVLFYLQCGSDKAFVREELMHIPENTQVPPEWVSQFGV